MYKIILTLYRLIFFSLLQLTTFNFALASSTVYEDAESGDTVGWEIYDNVPIGALIVNTFDATKNSRVISFSGDGKQNGYRLGHQNANNSNAWGNTNQTVISWDSKFSDNTIIYIPVETTHGPRFLYYTPTLTDRGIYANDSRFIHHGITSNASSWSSVNRDLQADLRDFEPDSEIISVNGILIRGTGQIDNIQMRDQLPPPSEIIYEDAEGGNANKWDVYDKTPTEASIKHVFDTQKDSNVIEFIADGIQNGFRIGHNNSNNSNAWVNSNHKIISWDSKFQESVVIYIPVQTTYGFRYLYYTNANTDRGVFHKNNKYIHFGLGRSLTNGSWQTFERDLAADLRLFEPENNIVSVNGFLIRGSGYVDNILMKSSLNVAPSRLKVYDVNMYCTNSSYSVEISDAGVSNEGGKILSSSCIDGVSISFSHPVSKNTDHIELIGVNGKIDLTVGDIGEGIVNSEINLKLSKPLPSGKYILKIKDEFYNSEGLVLDGEWSFDKAVSGNDIDGGDYLLPFDILIGDLNQDNKVTIADLGLLSSKITQNVFDPSMDVNLDGKLDSTDVELIKLHFGELLPDMNLSNNILSLNIGDNNQNDNEEIAVIFREEFTYLNIYELKKAKRLSSLRLPSSFSFIDIQPIIENDVVTAIALLGVHDIDGFASVWRYDLAGNILSGSIHFENSFLAKSLLSLSQNEISVTGMLSGQSITKIVNFDNNENFTINHGKNFIVRNTSFSTETNRLLILGKLLTTGDTTLKIYDVTSKNQVGDVNYGTYNPIDLTIVKQSPQNEELYAVLREKKKDENYVRIDIKNILNERIRLLRHETEANPIEITSTPTKTKLALLTSYPQNQEDIISVFNMTNLALEWSSSFGAGTQPSNLLVSASPEAENHIFSVLQINRLFGIAQIKSKNFPSNTRVKTIPIIDSVDPQKWFTKNRVHAHTRLNETHPVFGLDRGWHETKQSKRAGEFFSNMGAKVFTRHVNSFDEDPWWPSKYPVTSSGESQYKEERINKEILVEKDENIIQPYINEAWANGLPLIAYYSDSSEENIALNNPNWICKNRRGIDLEHPSKGHYLDITGQYGNLVKDRLLELADMGVSGIYLDFVHLPAIGCWQTPFSDDFEDQYGIPAPIDIRSPDYLLFVEFYAKRLTEVMNSWKIALAEEYPHLALIISVTSVPALTRMEMNSDLVNVANAKSEFGIATKRFLKNSVFFNNPEMYVPDKSILMALGFSLLRDLSSNGTPHIWNAHMPNKDHVKAFLSSILTFGLIAALDVVEDLIVPEGYVDGFTSRSGLASGFHLGNQVSPHFQDMNPIKWAGILFSETARNEYSVDTVSAWENTLYPVVGAYQALKEIGLPAGIVNDTQLLDTNVLIDNYKVLFLPVERNKLSNEANTAIDIFLAAGGKLVSTPYAEPWSTSLGYSTNLERLKSLFIDENNSSPISISNLPERVHLVSYKQKNKKKYLIAATNDFTFVQHSIISTPVPVDEVNLLPESVPHGITVKIKLENIESDEAHSSFFAYDVITQNSIPVQLLDDSIVLILPEFNQLSLIVVEKL